MVAGRIGEVALCRMRPNRSIFAKPPHRGQSALEQIQLSIGHESILTTERYLNVRQDAVNHEEHPLQACCSRKSGARGTDLLCGDQKIRWIPSSQLKPKNQNVIAAEPEGFHPIAHPPRPRPEGNPSCKLLILWCARYDSNIRPPGS